MNGSVASFLYFAYGRHLDEAALQGLCVGSELLCLAKLEGHGLAVASHGGLTVRPAPGESVWGAVWLVPATFLPALDAFHGVAAGRYEQTSRRILTPAGPRVESTIYLTPQPGEPPAQVDRATLREIAAAARAIGLSPAAVARIERCGKAK